MTFGWVDVGMIIFMPLVIGVGMYVESRALRRRLFALEVEVRALAGRDVARIDAVQRMMLERAEAESPAPRITP